jgi:protein-S-isoprenylcysteine O-methyltransferase Ste14
MYGSPLTMYVLAGWQGDPHLNPLHILSNLLIGGGFLLLAASWHVLYGAQRQHTLALTAPYTHVRHPPYVGFILIMLGFLLPWPTLITLLMLPRLVTMYVQLAPRAPREGLTACGETYARYTANTPAFVVRLGREVEREA